MKEQTFTNLSISDRVVRFVVGAFLIGVAMAVAPAPVWLALVAPYPVTTAIMGWDPLYAVAHYARRDQTEHDEPMPVR